MQLADPFSPVPYIHIHKLLVTPQLKPNRFTLAAVMDGVGNQIVEDTVKRLFIPPRQQRLIREVDDHRKPFNRQGIVKG
ncbi:hypothetical protein D3C76_1532910 [compost metagenome]